MRPAIATVIGVGWEPLLAGHARATGLARLVGRCSDAASLRALLPRVDALFIGSEVPWLADLDLAGIADATAVIGVAADGPGERMLSRAGIAEVVRADTPPEGLLAIAAAHTPPTAPRLIEVTGPRGAPGRSEVALAIAWSLAAHEPTALVELDVEAPSLGLRLGLPPGETLTEPARGPSVIPAPIATDGGSPLARDVLRVVAEAHRSAVLDTGPASDRMRFHTDEVVVVGEATDRGILRLARMCATWTGPVPTLVINRHRADQGIAIVREATGLEPATVIPEFEGLSRETADRRMVAHVGAVLDRQRAAL